MTSPSDLIRREGPITFDRFMEAALYGEGGFFASGRGARTDFVTSPQVGSLFGACVARALDGFWDALERPDPFLVVEAGAGNGQLARDVLRAAPECARALRYVLVERSAALRQEQRARLPLDPPDEALGPFVRRAGDDAPVPAVDAGPIFVALDELPAIEARDCVVLANELLDNLPFGIAEFDGAAWNEVRVGLEGEVLVPADPLDLVVPAGTRVPIPRGLCAWFAQCDALVQRGFMLFIDYMTYTPELRLRTYAGHARDNDPLVAPGSRDITADVVVDQLRAAAVNFAIVSDMSQAEWLRGLGIGAMAEKGAQRWRDGAHRGDLDALAGRSHAHEALVLTDPAGLGAHRVIVLSR